MQTYLTYLMIRANVSLEPKGREKWIDSSIYLPLCMSQFSLWSSLNGPLFLFSLQSSSCWSRFLPSLLQKYIGKNLWSHKDFLQHQLFCCRVFCKKKKLRNKRRVSLQSVSLILRSSNCFSLPHPLLLLALWRQETEIWINKRNWQEGRSEWRTWQGNEDGGCRSQ